jgi:hypothetical protein
LPFDCFSMARLSPRMWTVVQPKRICVMSKCS